MDVLFSFIFSFTFRSKYQRKLIILMSIKQILNYIIIHIMPITVQPHNIIIKIQLFVSYKDRNINYFKDSKTLLFQIIIIIIPYYYYYSKFIQLSDTPNWLAKTISNNIK